MTIVDGGREGRVVSAGNQRSIYLRISFIFSSVGLLVGRGKNGAGYASAPICFHPFFFFFFFPRTLCSSFYFSSKHKSLLPVTYLFSSYGSRFLSLFTLLSLLRPSCPLPSECTE